jgi:pimeloyl-ACP methyl ester carboxylesterase
VPADGGFEWAGFAADVLAAVDGLGLEQPIGVGHSLGGAALLLAEQERPGTFSALYCFEPVVLPDDGPSPAHDSSRRLAVTARQRREIFASRSEARENYASKPPLDTLDREALAAYVEYGFEDLPDGTVRLRCRGETEARIYEKAGAHRAFASLASVRCPVVLACGAKTDSFGPDALELLAARFGDARVETVPSVGHLGPLERPGVVARSIIPAIDLPRA